MSSSSDIHYMRHALSLAKRGLGRTAPNPAVGCVIVKNEVIVGRGWTADGGRPHAEARALAAAGQAARGATAYVTLEPCAHYGKTPPCAQTLAAAGVARVVMACGDPDPRVSGKGIAILRQEGVEVTEHILEEEARALNAGFIYTVTRKRPYVTLKLAVSKDEKIAKKQGVRTAISSDATFRYMHLLRTYHDAILVGAETARIDQPKLTARIPGYNHQAQRIVLDGHGACADETKIVLTNVDIDTRDLKAVMELLVQRGVTRLLVEGGARIHSAFLEAGLCDEFFLTRAPDEIGSHGVDALHGYDLSALETEFGLKKQKTRILGKDLLEIYARKA